MLLKVISWVFLIIGIISVIFSYLLFEGLFAELYCICGSACAIWPGIRLNIACIEICIARNGFYFLFFMIGIIFVQLGIGGFLIIRERS